MSSIAGQTLFNSGPHRFIIKPIGMLFVPPLVFDPIQINTNVITPLEFAIIQTGRLIAPSERDLWTLINDIKAKAEAQLTGILITTKNTSWSNMTFLRFASDDRVDRGRTISLAYTAIYIRLA